MEFTGENKLQEKTHELYFRFEDGEEIKISDMINGRFDLPLQFNGGDEKEDFSAKFKNPKTKKSVGFVIKKA